MYTFGSAGTRSTDMANKKALEKYKLVPRMLVEATSRSIEASILLAMDMAKSMLLLVSSRQPFSGLNIHHPSSLPRLVCKAFYTLMVSSLQLERPVMLVFRS